MSHDWSDGVLLGSLQRTKQLIIWWCGNQTVEWVQQHHSSQICDGMCGANTVVCTSSVMEEQFGNFSFVMTLTAVICRLLNTLRTGDADLRLYITTVQDG